MSIDDDVVLLERLPTLRLLGAEHNPTGTGWAAPGTHYGQRIAEIARAISEVRT